MLKPGKLYKIKDNTNRHTWHFSTFGQNEIYPGTLYVSGHSCNITSKHTFMYLKCETNLFGMNSFYFLSTEKMSVATVWDENFLSLLAEIK